MREIIWELTAGGTRSDGSNRVHYKEKNEDEVSRMFPMDRKGEGPLRRNSHEGREHEASAGHRRKAIRCATCY